MSQSFSSFDDPIVSARCFFPRPARLEEPFFVDVGELRLACHVRAPHVDAPMVVHFHGNGEVVADYAGGRLEEALVRLGFNVCFAEYRGYGASTGRPAMAAMLGDVEAIVDALGVADERIVAFGRSIGSIYAIELASRRPRIAALVIESGLSSPIHFVLSRVRPAEIGCVRDELEYEARDRLDHQRKLGGFERELLVLHAARDLLVPVQNAEHNHGWAQKANRKLVVFDAGDHNSILAWNFDAYLAELGELLERI